MIRPLQIDLTAKEFALLECLLRMRGKVLSRPRILEQVWGFSADPLTNVVDVQIRQLRRKIDDGHEVKLIRTVRGYGYKLEASSQDESIRGGDKESGQCDIGTA